MKIAPVVILGLAGLGGAVLQAQAAETATPYVQIGAGINFMNSLKFTDTAGTTSRSSLNFDPGPAVTGSVGYAFGNNLRAEFELGYRDAPGSDITFPSGGTSSSVKGGAELYTYMVNGLYDFDLGSPKWYPHLGFGIGAVNVNSSRSPAETVFAYQAIAGVEYELQPRLRLGLDYRYLGSDTVHLTFTQPGFAASRGVSSEVENHTVLFTLRWNFYAP
jgi:opacity protein-like surface antigen